MSTFHFYLGCALLAVVLTAYQYYRRKKKVEKVRNLHMEAFIESVDKNTKTVNENNAILRQFLNKINEDESKEKGEV